MGIPEEEKEKETECLLKGIMSENVLNFGSDMNIQIHEAQRTSNRLNLNRATLRHIN